MLYVERCGNVMITVVLKTWCSWILWSVCGNHTVNYSLLQIHKSQTTRSFCFNYHFDSQLAPSNNKPQKSTSKHQHPPASTIHQHPPASTSIPVATSATKTAPSAQCTVTLFFSPLTTRATGQPRRISRPCPISGRKRMVFDRKYHLVMTNIAMERFTIFNR